ncbi:glycosyltransferase family 4 protein [Loktanella sp. TSTF-M6]|uniref:Glycosyltransferase family 4 protein n=1 Tax=Loktanella gaetbuli TaxID=2881335 RepID=A0ABS8BY35_9RHOB|nr:glycosyltransferase family 4 protein [Loktanella gaetbuli]MCB5200650.1 glycosyltransferase family 4 protein [Loktanella gaetbuli]
MTGGGDMQVRAAPDWRQGNPYQQLLAQALSPLGVDVTFPCGYRRGLPLWRDLRSGPRPQILHLHWPEAYLRRTAPLLRAAYVLRTLADLALVKRGGTRLVWTAHNLTGHDTATPRLDLVFARRLAGLADRIITHGDGARDAVVDRLGADPARITVIPHGTFRDVYGPAPDRATARAALGLDPDLPLALFFGMIRPYKGVLPLLDAWEALGTRRGAAQLMIAGEAPDPTHASAVSARAQHLPQVRLDMGKVPDDRVPLLLAAADVLVLPFAASLTSGTVTLAQDYGVPVVVPRTPGTAEARNAVIADDTTPGPLGQAILQALALPRGPRTPDPATGWDRVAAQHRAVFEQALEAGT